MFNGIVQVIRPCLLIQLKIYNFKVIYPQVISDRILSSDFCANPYIFCANTIFA